MSKFSSARNALSSLDDVDSDPEELSDDEKLLSEWSCSVARAVVLNPFVECLKPFCLSKLGLLLLLLMLWREVRLLLLTMLARPLELLMLWRGALPSDLGLPKVPPMDSAEPLRIPLALDGKDDGVQSSIGGNITFVEASGSGACN
jgi:hypothetical protein